NIYRLEIFEHFGLLLLILPSPKLLAGYNLWLLNKQPTGIHQVADRLLLIVLLLDN
ncbi:9584_t:CDS:1, partial [Racocetra persica]